jgi:hypothetical protein
LIETKWGGSPWDVDVRSAPFRSALEQTARNARQLSLWHGVAKHGRPQVQPVLVVWGPAGRRLRELPVRRHESGVVVMPGDRLQEWMRRRDAGRLAADQVDGVFEDMDRHLVARDAKERSSRPMPPLLGEVLRRTLVGLGIAVAAFLATGYVLRASASLVVWVATALLVISVAGLTRRRAHWRWEVGSFEVGYVGLHLLTAVAVVRAYR